MAVSDIQESEGAVGLSAAVGGRAGVEDPLAVFGVVQRDVGVTEDHQVRCGEVAGRPAAWPESWIMATSRPPRSRDSVSGAPQAATSGLSLLPRTARTGA